MVVRIAGYGYQKGFGGHFHNDNAVGVLRDVPGIVVASPARPGDAAAVLRTCVASAATDGTVCVFLEPIALYHTRDLPRATRLARTARRRACPDRLGADARRGSDLTIVTWANGFYLSVRAARRLAAHGVGVRIVDLRWLAPLPEADVLREAAVTGRVLVVDETRTGGVSEGILASLVDTSRSATQRGSCWSRRTRSRRQRWSS